MKNTPRHIQKLNRLVIRLNHREEQDSNLLFSPPRKQTVRQIKKQAKTKIRQEREERVPIHLTPEEKNKKMRHRVPEFERNNKAVVKTTKPTRKKTPKI